MRYFAGWVEDGIKAAMDGQQVGSGAASRRGLLEVDAGDFSRCASPIKCATCESRFLLKINVS